MVSFSLPFFPESFQEELRYLQNKYNDAEQIVKHAPLGDLRIRSRKASRYYSLVWPGADGKPKETYLKADDPAFPVYISKYCAKKVLAKVQESIRQLQNTPLLYSEEGFQNLLGELEASFGELVPECFHSHKYMIEQWQQAPYVHNPSYPEELIYRTHRHELVRSKNECLCANILHDEGLSYRYECELILQNGEKVYPDFTILSPVNRKIYYLEVCGKMDDPKYVGDYMRKIHKYTSNGIQIGNELLLVFESRDYPFSTGAFSDLLDQTVLARS